MAVQISAEVIRTVVRMIPTACFCVTGDDDIGYIRSSKKHVDDERCGWKRSWSILRYHPMTCLGGMRKIMKNLRPPVDGRWDESDGMTRRCMAYLMELFQHSVTK